jgi:choline kinase
MQAVILGIGHGIRLRPLIRHVSQAMVFRAGAPLTKRLVVNLREGGCMDERAFWPDGERLSDLDAANEFFRSE